MKAAVFTGPGRLTVQEVPTPTPGPDEVLVRIRACAICGSDIRTVREGHRLITPPHVIGHEIAGEIVEVGCSVHDFAVNDRVTVATSIPACRVERASRAWVTSVTI